MNMRMRKLLLYAADKCEDASRYLRGKVFSSVDLFRYSGEGPGFNGDMGRIELPYKVNLKYMKKGVKKRLAVAQKITGVNPRSKKYLKFVSRDGESVTYSWKGPSWNIGCGEEDDDNILD